MSKNLLNDIQFFLQTQQIKKINYSQKLKFGIGFLDVHVGGLL